LLAIVDKIAQYSKEIKEWLRQEQHGNFRLNHREKFEQNDNNV
jgi:hypothetical protein